MTWSAQETRLRHLIIPENDQVTKLSRDGEEPGSALEPGLLVREPTGYWTAVYSPVTSVS